MVAGAILVGRVGKPVEVRTAGERMIAEKLIEKISQEQNESSKVVRIAFEEKQDIYAEFARSEE